MTKEEKDQKGQQKVGTSLKWVTVEERIPISRNRKGQAGQETRC